MNIPIYDSAFTDQFSYFRFQISPSVVLFVRLDESIVLHLLTLPRDFPSVLSFQLASLESPPFLGSELFEVQLCSLLKT